jgi:hypothetical protein
MQPEKPNTHRRVAGRGRREGHHGQIHVYGVPRQALKYASFKLPLEPRSLSCVVCPKLGRIVSVGRTLKMLEWLNFSPPDAAAAATQLGYGAARGTGGPRTASTSIEENRMQAAVASSGQSGEWRKGCVLFTQQLCSLGRLVERGGDRGKALFSRLAHVQPLQPIRDSGHCAA